MSRVRFRTSTMSVHLATPMGVAIDDPSIDQMRRVLLELDPLDREHGAAWLATDSADPTVLEYGVGARLAFHHRGRVSHLHDVSHERVVQLWSLLAQGNIAVLAAQPWRPGAGHLPIDPEREARIDAAMIASDRKFYDLLGRERPELPCQTEGCTRGSVRWSVLCRPPTAALRSRDRNTRRRPARTHPETCPPHRASRFRLRQTERCPSEILAHGSEPHVVAERGECVHPVA